MVDNGSIYNLVDSTRRELNGAIIRVETKVDMAQADISNLKVQEATLNTKVYVLVFIISTTVSAIASAIALRLLK